MKTETNSADLRGNVQNPALKSNDMNLKRLNLIEAEKSRRFKSLVWTAGPRSLLQLHPHRIIGESDGSDSIYPLVDG